MSSDLSIALFEGGKYRVVNIKDLLSLALREILRGDYVFKFSGSKREVYFVSTDKVYLHLKEHGREIYWLHDLFESWRRLLKEISHSDLGSIYMHSLKTLHVLHLALKVFPGSEVYNSEEEAMERFCIQKEDITREINFNDLEEGEAQWGPLESTGQEEKEMEGEGLWGERESIKQKRQRKKNL